VNAGLAGTLRPEKRTGAGAPAFEPVQGMFTDAGTPLVLTAYIQNAEIRRSPIRWCNNAVGREVRGVVKTDAGHRVLKLPSKLSKSRRDTRPHRLRVQTSDVRQAIERVAIRGGNRCAIVYPRVRVVDNNICHGSRL
jgi:hypothetical protein